MTPVGRAAAAWIALASSSAFLAWALLTPGRSLATIENGSGLARAAAPVLGLGALLAVFVACAWPSAPRARALATLAVAVPAGLAIASLAAARARAMSTGMLYPFPYRGFLLDSYGIVRQAEAYYGTAFLAAGVPALAGLVALAIPRDRAGQFLLVVVGTAAFFATAMLAYGAWVATEAPSLAEAARARPVFEPRRSPVAGPLAAAAALALTALARRRSR